MAAELELVPGKLVHAMELSADMVPADVAELEACGYQPSQGLVHALSVSEVAVAALDEGRVAAMFGVAPLRRGATLLGAELVHRLWFLTGPRFRRRPLVSARTARRVVAALLEAYPVLENAIDGRHVDALRFASMLGADFGQPFAMPPSGLLFVPFRISSR